MQRESPSFRDIVEAYTEEIVFWSRQIMEHMLFIFDGIDEKVLSTLPPIKYEDTFMGPLLDFGGKKHTLKSAALHFMKQWGSVFESSRKGNLDLFTVHKLADQTLMYKYIVREYLSGIYLGPGVSFSLLSHMIEELQHFIFKINVKFDRSGQVVEYIPADETRDLLFWATERATETMEVGQLLDVTENKLIETARSTAKNLLKTKSAEKVLGELFNLDDFYQEINQRIENKTLRAKIPQILAEHILREQERAKDVIGPMVEYI